MIKEFIFELFSFIGELNYGVVFLLSALESTCFPVIIPVETIIIPMGYYAYLGTKSLLLLIIFTTSGIVVGCVVNYWFARMLGRNFIYKHAKLLHINIEKLHALENKFLSHGRLLMFIGRFIPIPAFKHIITIPAGIAKMPIGIFIFYNFLGGLIFSTSMLLIGYFFGSSETLVGNIHKVIEKITIICLILFATYCVIKFVIYKIKRKRNMIRQDYINTNNTNLEEFYNNNQEDNSDYDLFDKSERYFKNKRKHISSFKRGFAKRRKNNFARSNYNYDDYSKRKKMFKNVFKNNAYSSKFTNDDISDLMDDKFLNKNSYMSNGKNDYQSRNNNYKKVKRNTKKNYKKH